MFSSVSASEEPHHEDEIKVIMDRICSEEDNSVGINLFLWGIVQAGITQKGEVHTLELPD